MVDENNQLSNANKLLAGLGAGVCEAVIAVTPMETIKVKFINDQRGGSPKFKGLFHGVYAIVKGEGNMTLTSYYISRFISFVLYRRWRCL